MKKSKIFVLDTNVLLHDHRSIYNFQDNDVVIPITVLEELDKFKKGYEQINFQARMCVRMLDKLVGDDLFNGGISLGENLGKLMVTKSAELSPRIRTAFLNDIPDHRILSTAEKVKEENPDRSVVLVSKDINLRLKAKSIGVEAQDYKSDKIANLEVVYQGLRFLKDIDDTLVDKLYSEGKIEFSALQLETQAFTNEYFILQGASKSAISWYNYQDKSLYRIEKHEAFGIRPRNAEQTVSLHALTNPAIKLISLTGKAGTGKTLLALAAAIHQHELYDQILLARPIVALSNRDLGYLPGDAKEKINPYMAPLYDNLGVIKRNLKLHSSDFKMLEDMQAQERLTIMPLAYIRGRSLNNCFFIVDEAQNLTPHEVKTIITRAGEGSKIIFTGDIQQIDSPYLDQHSNGLAFLTARMRNQKLFAHVNLVKGERSELAEIASDLL